MHSPVGKKSVDLAAPGDTIWSTNASGSYDASEGPSMATPFVTGAAALTIAKCGKLPPAEISKRIVGNVRPLHSLKGLILSEGTLCLEYLTRDCNAPAEPCK